MKTRTVQIVQRSASYETHVVGVFSNVIFARNFVAKQTDGAYYEITPFKLDRGI